MSETLEELVSSVDPESLELFRNFMKELNRRERVVRFDRTDSFDSYKEMTDHGWGFSVDGRSVPYFHPNRSFHDEIVWLNRELFYNSEATFEDRLINSAIVKFYGPSKTLELITEGTGLPFVVYDRFVKDPEYVALLCYNLEDASASGEKIYGTTELRTSLQTASRNYTREIGGPMDRNTPEAVRLERKSRKSDILFWFTLLGPKMVEFYSTSPTMEESFNFLTSFPGIGNYYGYHLSSNLARMPEIGTLVKDGAPTGNLSEDDPFVIAGVGAMDTINWLFGKASTKRAQSIIQEIRSNQNEWFDFNESDGTLEDARMVTETGSFTHFGIEISCCQFSVYRRLREDKAKASLRANAPISKESISSTPGPVFKDMTLDDFVEAR